MVKIAKLKDMQMNNSAAVGVISSRFQLLMCTKRTNERMMGGCVWPKASFIFETTKTFSIKFYIRSFINI
jgi:hypothetical protein